MRSKPKPPRPAFPDAVMKAVRGIKRGQVRSYSQVALMAGRPGAARGVGQLLATLPNVPWWRVVRADGSLAPAVAREQKKRLEAEGHAVKGHRLSAGRPRMG